MPRDSLPTREAGEMAKRLVVVAAGLSQPSSTRLLADRLAQATRTELAARGVPVEIETLELRDHAHDVTTRLVNGYSTPELEVAVERLTGADAAIVVTPVFAASYSGLFKSFFDIIEPDALAGLPLLIAATGGSERHSLVLEHAVRPLFSYLRAAVVPTAVYAATADWAGPDRRTMVWSPGSTGRQVSSPAWWSTRRPAPSGTRSSSRTASTRPVSSDPPDPQGAPR